MKTGFFSLLFASALALVFAGCEKSATPPDSAVLFQVVQDNVRALEKKDMEAVMSTVHPKSPSYASMRGVMGDMFKVLDLKCTLSDLKVVNSSVDEAQVSFVQKTEKVGGSGNFVGNVVEGVHTLRPDNGKWKIYWTVQSKVSGLDGKPFNPGEPAPPAPTEQSAPAPAPSPAPTAEPAPKPAPPTEKPAQ